MFRVGPVRKDIRAGLKYLQRLRVHPVDGSQCVTPKPPPPYVWSRRPAFGDKNEVVCRRTQVTVSVDSGSRPGVELC